MTSARRPHRPARDPQRTQERILKAALREFAAKGFAGARVDAIARRARINKRMLYHYFGNKDGLFREILRRKIREHAGWANIAPDDPADGLPYWFDVACEDREWIRLLQWEALQVGEHRIIGEAERREAVEAALARFRDRQRRGLLPPDLDSGHLLLSIMAVMTFPLAFPQLTRLVVGRGPHDPGFRKERTVFLRDFALAIGPRPPRNP